MEGKAGASFPFFEKAGRERKEEDKLNLNKGSPKVIAGQTSLRKGALPLD